MSDLSIGSDVSKIVMGNQTLWERPNYDTTWIELPDDGGSGDYTGLEFMSFNPKTSTARFLGFRKLVIPYGTPSKKRLLFELPKGYMFSETNDNSVMSSLSVNGTFNEFKINLTFEGNQVYNTFGDSNTSLIGNLVVYPHIHMVRAGSILYTQYDTVFTNTLTFNVTKED